MSLQTKDNTFIRVKSIIDRLRDFLKCQKCTKLLKEDSMMFYHICDHFYCVNCIKEDKSCPLCKNPLDLPMKVLNDKNMLSLYQSLLNFELPSRNDVEKIYRNHKATKEILKNLEKCSFDVGETETPKNQKAKSSLRVQSLERSKTKNLGGVKGNESKETGDTPKRIKSNSAEEKNISSSKTPLQVLEKTRSKTLGVGQSKENMKDLNVSHSTHDTPKGSKASAIEEKDVSSVGKSALVHSLEKNKNKTSGVGQSKENLKDAGDSNTKCDTPKGIRVNLNEEKNASVGKTRSTTPARKGKNFSPPPIPKTKNNTPVTTPAGRAKNSTPVTSAGSGKGSASKLNVNKRNPKGETQLHLACKKSNFSLMSELIAAGANPNAQDNAGWTPLHDSVFSGNLEVMKFLLDNGAKVNAPGLESTTALHEAIAKGNVKVVRLLLDYGADINAMNIFRETPLDLVTKYDLKELKEILLESANNEKTGTGSSANVEEPESFILYKHSLSIEEEKLVNKFADKFDAQIIPSVTLKVPPTHIIVPGVKFDVTWTMILSVLSGCWAVTSDWVKDSLKEEVPKPASTYELPKDKFPGFSKARLNKINQLPGLFSGCHFFFGGNFESYAVKSITFRKEDLKALVEKHGGVIVKRSPDPESLALEKTVPFHANVTSSLKETSYFIIYQEDKWDPKPKYNMSHMKTLPVEWLLSCIFKFELLEPTQQGSWCDFL